MPEPSVVLVHGAFADSSSWHDTINRLEAHGHRVLAVPNQLRGLVADADYVRSIVSSIDGPVVLVGHSYGGAVIGEAARGASNVAGLVFIAAYILDEGESISTVLNPAAHPGALLGPTTTVVRPCTNSASPDGHDLDIFIRPEDFHAVFAADVDPVQTHVLALTQRPLAVGASTGVAGRPAWRDLPSWALVSHDDRAIPASGQTWMAERAHAVMSSIDSSHAVMLSHPDVVADVIGTAVTTVAGASTVAS
ncbi:alpha/beta hydrolase [Nocardioides sp. CN2-186]|uniref:alpha/beta fold hydrolase n=1 Tax=Nocardioides tweenelious TaxID=3156607 RepID=UPI0032B39CCF